MTEDRLILEIGWSMARFLFVACLTVWVQVSQCLAESAEKQISGGPLCGIYDIYAAARILGKPVPIEQLELLKMAF
jgi:hypothetical protein